MTYHHTETTPRRRLLVRPGDFLTAVLCNNFWRAVLYADDTNEKALRDYALFIYNQLPPDAWGSEESMQAWMEKKQAARGPVKLGDE